MSILDFFSKNKNMNIVKQMSVNEISELLNNKGYVFIDVREPNEWKDGVIQGVKKISMGDIEKHFSEMPKESNYVIICRSGNRSGKVAEKMALAGYKNIINFKGGMMDWYAKGLPTE